MAREFTVFPVVNGWVVKVGCSMFAYTDKTTLHSDILEYLTDPDKKEREMLDRFIRPKAPIGPKEDVVRVFGGLSGCGASEAEPSRETLEKMLRRQ